MESELGHCIVFFGGGGDIKTAILGACWACRDGWRRVQCATTEGQNGLTQNCPRQAERKGGRWRKPEAGLLFLEPNAEVTQPPAPSRARRRSRPASGSPSKRPKTLSAPKASQVPWLREKGVEAGQARGCTQDAPQHSPSTAPLQCGGLSCPL